MPPELNAHNKKSLLWSHSSESLCITKCFITGSQCDLNKNGLRPAVNDDACCWLTKMKYSFPNPNPYTREGCDSRSIFYET